MGLLKNIKNIDSYINIESFDVNLKKKRVRVRIRLYNSFGDDEPYNTDEVIIDFDAFKKCCEDEAVKGVDVKKIRKEINKLDKTKQEKDLLFLEAKSAALADSRKIVASQLRDNLIMDMDKTVKIMYENLKMVIGGKDKQ